MNFYLADSYLFTENMTININTSILKMIKLFDCIHSMQNYDLNKCEIRTLKILIKFYS